MEVKRLRTLALEVFKTLNNMNPEYMKEIFHKTAFMTHRPLNLEVGEAPGALIRGNTVYMRSRVE